MKPIEILLKVLKTFLIQEALPINFSSFSQEISDSFEPHFWRWIILFTDKITGSKPPPSPPISVCKLLTNPLPLTLLSGHMILTLYFRLVITKADGQCEIQNPFDPEILKFIVTTSVLMDGKIRQTDKNYNKFLKDSFFFFLSKSKIYSTINKESFQPEIISRHGRSVQFNSLTKS